MKMELTGFADGLDIGDGRKEELGNSQLLWVVLSEGKEKVSGVRR